jgi:K+-transporting ATPase ATPase C chain
MRALVRQLRPAILAMVVLSVLLGVAYPMAATAIAQTAFHDRANGSLIHRDGVVVGSKLIGQLFVSPQYFHGRPSEAGSGYDASASSGSNDGPLNQELLTAVADRATAYRHENGLAADAPVPVDAVTASGSGLDPDISIANARLQANRVANARGLTPDAVNALVDEHTRRRDFAVLGEPGVNVLELNLALDQLRG